MHAPTASTEGHAGKARARVCVHAEPEHRAAGVDVSLFLGTEGAAQLWADGLHTFIFTGSGLKNKTLKACEERLGES